MLTRIFASAATKLAAIKSGMCHEDEWSVQESIAELELAQGRTGSKNGTQGQATRFSMARVEFNSLGQPND